MKIIIGFIDRPKLKFPAHHRTEKLYPRFKIRRPRIQISTACYRWISSPFLHASPILANAGNIGIQLFTYGITRCLKVCRRQSIHVLAHIEIPLPFADFMPYCQYVAYTKHLTVILRANHIPIFGRCYSHPAENRYHRLFRPVGITGIFIKFKPQQCISLCSFF